MLIVMVRQRRPLKILADGTFLLPYRKKISQRIIEEKKSSKLPGKVGRVFIFCFYFQSNMGRVFIFCFYFQSNMGRGFIFCFYFQQFKNIAQTSSILLFWLKVNKQTRISLYNPDILKCGLHKNKLWLGQIK
jgi:hypothetical protein